MQYPNLDPTNIFADCCDGAGSTDITVLSKVELFVQNTYTQRTESLPVQSNSVFKKGELATLSASGVITKLTAAPTSADNLVLIHYNIDNTAVAVAAGKAVSKATVLKEANGINAAALILPATVVMSDALIALLASKNLFITKQIGVI